MYITFLASAILAALIGLVASLPLPEFHNEFARETHSHSYVTTVTSHDGRIAGLVLLSEESQQSFGFALTNETRKEYVAVSPRHTSGHVDCQACSAIRDALMQTKEYKDLNVPQAGALWLETRRPYLKPKTFDHYAFCIKSLSRQWPTLKLSDIDIGKVIGYQQVRQVGEWRDVIQNGGKTKLRFCKADARTINHELCALSQILTRAGLWHAIEPYYEPLPEPKWTPPKVITQAEENRGSMYFTQPTENGSRKTKASPYIGEAEMKQIIVLTTRQYARIRHGRMFLVATINTRLDSGARRCRRRPDCDRHKYRFGRDRRQHEHGDGTERGQSSQAGRE